MYIIDKLQRIYGLYHSSTLDGELSAYLLRNLDDIQNISLQKCISDTGLSKSFIQKFYTKAGFLSFNSLTNIIHHEFNHMIQYELPYVDEEDFQFDEDQIDHLADIIMQANNVYLYGSLNEIHSLKKTSYLIYKMKKSIVPLNSWDLEESHNIIKQIHSNDVIIFVDTRFSAHTFHYIAITNSHMISPDVIGETDCHKFFIGTDNSSDYLGFHTINCPYINDYHTNILLEDLDNLIYDKLLERMD